MRKIFSLFGTLLLLVLLVSGCGVSDVANENELIDMLIANYPECLQRHIYQDETFEIDSLKIVRRQTDKKEKVDKVGCEIAVRNENYEGVFNYTLILNYYDKGGWYLENYESFSDDKLNAINNTVPNQTIDEAKRACYQNINNIANLTLVGEEFNQSSGILTQTYSVNADYENLTVSGNIIINYNFNNYNWEYEIIDNTIQKWKFTGTYVLDSKYYIHDANTSYADVVPKIYNVNNEGKNIASGISKITITKNNNAVEMDAEIIKRTYNGDSYSDSYSTQRLTFDTRNEPYSITLFENKDDSKIIIEIDPEIEIRLYCRNSYVNGKKHNYTFGFIPE